MKRFALLALVLLFAACSEFTGADTTDQIGVYNISSVNGAALPFTLADGDTTFEVTGGAVTLNADRSFTDHTTFRSTVGDSVATSEQLIQGQYLRTKNTITFEGNDGSFYTGDLNGSTLTIVVGSVGGTLQVAYTR